MGSNPHNCHRKKPVNFCHKKKSVCRMTNGYIFFVGKEVDGLISWIVFIVHKVFMKTEVLENENENNHSEGISIHYKIRKVRWKHQIDIFDPVIKANNEIGSSQAISVIVLQRQ